MSKLHIATRAQMLVISAHEATALANLTHRAFVPRPSRQQQLHDLYTFLQARRLRTLESLNLPPLIIDDETVRVALPMKEVI